MIVIGVLDEKRPGKIEQLIKRMFVLSNLKCIILDDKKARKEILNDLEKASIDCVILTLDKKRILPIYLDVLILENSKNITSELIKCISCDTRLIYNNDIECFNHINAISYGMSYNADVTVSSIDDKCDKISFNYCLQRSFMSLGGNMLLEGEFPMSFDNRCFEIEEILASVTCAMLCDVISLKALKVGINK